MTRLLWHQRTERKRGHGRNIADSGSPCAIVRTHSGMRQLLDTESMDHIYVLCCVQSTLQHRTQHHIVELHLCIAYVDVCIFV